MAIPDPIPKTVEIPVTLFREFEKEARVIIRHPWCIGIPVPELLLDKFARDPRFREELGQKFDFMLVPK
jgi:hypothetical protein